MSKLMKLKRFHKYNFIYITKNLITSHYYIGFHATNNINDQYFGNGKLLNKKMLEYEKNNFTREILENINPENWREKEKYWIERMKSHIKFLVI